MSLSSYFRIGAAHLALVAALLSTPAMAQNAADTNNAPPEPVINDPLEPLNRTIYGINEFIDIFLVTPFASIYKAVLPQPVQDSVRNVLRNLESPIVIANQALQGDWEGTQNALGRFGVNSTAGVLGIFDVADGMGMPYEDEDFGQTLAVWGADGGPYLVLPFLGPSNARDTVGIVADGFADPLNMYASNTDRKWIPLTRAAVTGIDTRSRLFVVIDDIRRNSLDPYATLRNLYDQSREVEINDGATEQPDIPDYSE